MERQRDKADRRKQRRQERASGERSEEPVIDANGTAIDASMPSATLAGLSAAPGLGGAEPAHGHASVAAANQGKPLA